MSRVGTKNVAGEEDIKSKKLLCFRFETAEARNGINLRMVSSDSMLENYAVFSGLEETRARPT
jgi:hypothetical protein